MVKIYGNIDKLYQNLFLKKTYNVIPDGSIANQEGITLVLKK